MRTIGFLLLFIFILIFSSCQKSVNVSNGTTGIDSTIDTGSTTNGALIQRITVNVAGGDSTIENFQYDANGFLKKTWTNNDKPVNYLRDTHKRIIKIYWLKNENDSSLTEVHYANEISTNIVYSISYYSSNPLVKIDSTVYTYTNNALAKAIIFSPNADTLRATYYYNFQFDQKLNLVKLIGFSLDENNNTTLNIGYDLEYDSKINPFYSHDDLLFIYHWDMASPHNIIKQTNHYYTPGISDDYINYAYQYNTDNKPVSAFWSGPRITDVNSFYFYK